MNIKDQPLEIQLINLKKIITKNPVIKVVLETNPFPKSTNWYLGAGCICQTVWNYLSGYEITQGIKDYDLVYCNPKDLSKDSELREQKRINKLFSNLNVQVEVVNEARVHLWFEKDFGKKIEQLKSCEVAINGWPTTATAIGINKIDKKINVYAPYGLNDLFGMVVRPNKPSVIKKVYEKKVERWIKIWPKLVVIPWNKI